MTKNVFEPFDKDVIERGGYVYSTTNKLSAIYSAGKTSQIILKTSNLSGKTVLDVGCGDGTYTNHLWENAGAKSILGIDPAPNSIEVAKKKYASHNKGLSFQNCYAKDILEQGWHFDVAICRGVLHHVGNPKDEIKCVLNLADVVYIIEPNGLNIILKILERLSKYHREHKEQSYTMATLKKWIKDSGGIVEKSFYHGLVPYFSPNIVVHIGKLLEPVIEPIPFINALVCGRMFIKVRKS
jgi:2-polyprenyl-3-methyl-5-hydroxy-6-metoxy-1,4-benzoquinol methylase